MLNVFTRFFLIALFSSLFSSTSYGQWSILGTPKFSNTFVSSIRFPIQPSEAEHLQDSVLARLRDCYPLIFLLLQT